MKKIIVSLTVFIVGVMIIWGYWRYNYVIIDNIRRFNYATDVFLSLNTDEPTEAYQGLRSALSRQDAAMALRYLSPASRDIYESILGDKSKRQLITAWPQELTKLYQVPCDINQECLELAVYRLDYQRQAFTVDFHGQTVPLSAGEVSRELVFIKNKAGKWWIKRL